MIDVLLACKEDGRQDNFVKESSLPGPDIMDNFANSTILIEI